MPALTNFSTIKHLCYTIYYITPICDRISKIDTQLIFILETPFCQIHDMCTSFIYILLIQDTPKYTTSSVRSLIQ